MIWTRSDRPARLWLEWATTASFANATRVRGPHMLEGADFTGRVDLTRLPADQAIVKRVLSEPLQGASAPATGAHPSPDHARRAFRLER